MTIEPGTLVVCTYRMPNAHQPWVHEIHVGITLESSDNPHDWNGRNSEAAYCHATGKTPVMWSFGKMHDIIADLIPITEAEAELDMRGKIARFLGAGSLAIYDRAMDPPKERAA